jgi:hypothetical protein
LVCATHALIAREGSIWVNLVLEARHECCSGRLGVVARVDLRMEGMCGDAR